MQAKKTVKAGKERKVKTSSVQLSEPPLGSGGSASRGDSSVELLRAGPGASSSGALSIEVRPPETDGTTETAALATTSEGDYTTDPMSTDGQPAELQPNALYQIADAADEAEGGEAALHPLPMALPPLPTVVAGSREPSAPSPLPPLPAASAQQPRAQAALPSLPSLPPLKSPSQSSLPLLPGQRSPSAMSASSAKSPKSAVFTGPLDPFAAPSSSMPNMLLLDPEVVDAEVGLSDEEAARL